MSVKCPVNDHTHPKVPPTLLGICVAMASISPRCAWRMSPILLARVLAAVAVYFSHMTVLPENPLWLPVLSMAEFMVTWCPAVRRTRPRKLGPESRSCNGCDVAPGVVVAAGSLSSRKLFSVNSMALICISSGYSSMIWSVTTARFPWRGRACIRVAP